MKTLKSSSVQIVQIHIDNKKSREFELQDCKVTSAPDLWPLQMLAMLTMSNVKCTISMVCKKRAWWPIRMLTMHILFDLGAHRWQTLIVHQTGCILTDVCISGRLCLLPTHRMATVVHMIRKRIFIRFCRIWGIWRFLLLLSFPPTLWSGSNSSGNNNMTVGAKHALREKQMRSKVSFSSSSIVLLPAQPLNVFHITWRTKYRAIYFLTQFPEGEMYCGFEHCDPFGGKGWTSKSVGAQLKGEGGSERVIPVTGKLTSWYSADSGPAHCSYSCITKQSQARCGAGQTLSHWVTLGAQVWHTWPYKVIQPLQI